MFGFVVYGVVLVTIPADEPADPNGEIDWIGAYLGVGGLILFNFVWKYVNSLPLDLSCSRRLKG